MAVFTTLERSDAETLLAGFDTGRLLDLQGIGAGMENSNYFVYCTDERKPGGQCVYVLTLLEELSTEQVHFHVRLLDTLAQQGIPVPRILRDKHNNAIHTVHGKPALLSTRLQGQHVDTPDSNHAAAVGALLADLHLAAGLITDNYHGTRDRIWLEQCVYQASPYLTDTEKPQVLAVLNNYLSIQPDKLPHGIIHGDVFRDNVFFDGNTLTGIIDFYSAGVGFLLFDLAVLVNDWCRNPDNSIDQTRYNALLAAYTNKRPWTEQEHLCWPLMLQVSAMRFWLSRLLAGSGRAENSLFIGKNPAEFRKLFYWHLSHSLMASTAY